MRALFSGFYWIIGFRCLSNSLCGRLVVLNLQNSHLQRNLKNFPCVFNSFLELSIIRIDKIDASQPASIIEFWFLDYLLLLSSLLSGPYFATKSQVW